MPNLTIDFKRYRSAKPLVMAYARFDHPRIHKSKLLKTKVGLDLDLGNGECHAGTVEELISIVKRKGLWGFCDTITDGRNNPIIHYWISKDSQKNDIPGIMELFGHETGHAIGYTSETMAIKFGVITVFSYVTMMEEVFGKKVCTKEK